MGVRVATVEAQTEHQQVFWQRVPSDAEMMLDWGLVIHLYVKAHVLVVKKFGSRAKGHEFDSRTGLRVVSLSKTLFFTLPQFTRLAKVSNTCNSKYSALSHCVSH